MKDSREIGQARFVRAGNVCFDWNIENMRQNELRRSMWQSLICDVDKVILRVLSVTLNRKTSRSVHVQHYKSGNSVFQSTASTIRNAQIMNNKKMREKPIKTSGFNLWFHFITLFVSSNANTETKLWWNIFFMRIMWPFWDSQMCCQTEGCIVDGWI